MVSPHISKMSKGFTLMELVLVIGLCAVIATFAETFAGQALGTLTCMQKLGNMRQNVENARFQAQFSQRQDIPIVEGSSVAFKAGRGSIEPDEIEVPVSASATCAQVIKINHVGTIN